MKKNVLVFPCGSEIGLDIHRQVKYSTHFHLIGGSSLDDHGKFVYDDYIGEIPYLNEDTFLPHLKDIVTKRNIDAIYPTMDSVIAFLKKNELYLGCKVIGSPAETNEICLSKERTYQELKGIIPLPNIYKTSSPLEYPVFIKPKIGYGSRGAKIVYNQKELEAEPSIDTKLILEYLPGTEYTVDCFTDRHGKLLFCAARERSRIRMGISVNTTFVDNQLPFTEMAITINKKLKLRGAWFFQLKRNKCGNLTLLEVATRFGGSSLLCSAIGVNFPLLALFDAFDHDVQINPNQYPVILDRAFSSKYHIDIKFSTVYVDFDDCLILNEVNVNIALVSFLFECINKGIQIILISKHKGDLHQKLKHFRLYDLFDKIIHLKPTDEKYKYFNNRESIFIDDSFEEREKVKQHIGIPVFAPEMIDIFV